MTELIELNEFTVNVFTYYLPLH